MSIYLWEIPESIPNKLIGEYQDEYVNGLSPDRYLFLRGIKLSPAQITPTPNIEFEVPMHRLEPYDCLINNITTPVVNSRLADLLMTLAKEDVQLFDVKIECSDGELPGYQLLNIAQTIKGIDHEESIYTTQKLSGGDEIIGTIRRLVFKPGCMGTHHLARDVDEMQNILVSQTIYDAFRREKIKGARIVTPDDYYHYS